MKKFLHLFMIFFSLTGVSYSQSIETAYIYSDKKQTFENFLLHQLLLEKSVVYQKKYIQHLKRWNPTIKDPLMIEKGKRLYIELPYGSLDRYRNHKKLVKIRTKQRKQKVLQARKIASLQEARINKQATRQKVKSNNKNQNIESYFSVFYTISKGVFSEKSNGVNLETNQDSPITLGMAGRFILSNDFSLSTSAYISKLDGAGTGQDEKINLPLETGANLYLDYNRFSFSPYLGIDYEQFSTFNTDELVLNETLTTRQHTITYATIGIAHTFNISNREFYTKIDYSRSVQSHSSRKSIVTDKDFNGSRYTLYINTPITKKWSSHLLYKHHTMDGATNLNISRIGIGLGYKF